MKKYFKIKYFEKSLHPDVMRTKHAPIKWIKLYSDLLYDSDFLNLLPLQRLAFLSLLMLAAEQKNILEWDADALKTAAFLPESPALELFEAMGLIEKVDGLTEGSISWLK